MSGPGYLRPKAVGDLLGLHERTIRRWIADGKLPSHRIGGARLIAVPDLERLLAPQLKLDEESDGENE